MCKGSLHLPCVIETQLSLKTAASLALRWRQLCYYAPCSMKSGGALLDFQLSVDFLTTTVSKHLHAIPLYHPLGFLVQSLNTSLLLPLTHSNFWQLAHCLPLQRTPGIILGNFKNDRGDSYNAGFSSSTVSLIN